MVNSIRQPRLELVSSVDAIQSRRQRVLGNLLYQQLEALRKAPWAQASAGMGRYLTRDGSATPVRRFLSASYSVHDPWNQWT
jgi:hypothetical protein